jgi:hypothetical protein
LDFTQPIALMLMGILGHIGDHDEARSILKRLLDPLPSGSYLALNDGTNVISQAFAQAQQRYNESGALPYHLRSPEQIAGFFDGLELVEPGLVSVPRWRPDPADADGDLPAEVDAFGGVGPQTLTSVIAKLAGTSAHVSMWRGADLPHRLCGLAGSSTTRQRPASGFLQDHVEEVHGLVGGCGTHADPVHDVQVLVDIVAPVEVQGIGQVLDIDHIR